MHEALEGAVALARPPLLAMMQGGDFSQPATGLRDHAAATSVVLRLQPHAGRQIFEHGAEIDGSAGVEEMFGHFFAPFVVFPRGGAAHTLSWLLIARDIKCYVFWG